jgi:hypothetical protein
MGKLVEPSQLPVHRGLNDHIAARLLVPRLPDNLNKAGRRPLALPLGERLIEPAEELSQRIRHSVLTGQNAPTQHDHGPASAATCNTTSAPVGMAPELLAHLQTRPPWAATSSATGHRSTSPTALAVTWTPAIATTTPATPGHPSGLG